MCKTKEALEAIKAMDDVTITPAQAAPAIGCDPHWIRIMAREHPEKLGFPVIILRSRTKIPRLPFIRYIEGTA
jgi:hypothetical protein